MLNASGGVVLTYENKSFIEIKNSGIKLHGEQNVVEIGDFNNDKKPDVIFSVNDNKSKIFLNSKLSWEVTNSKLLLHQLFLKVVLQFLKQKQK